MKFAPHQGEIAAQPTSLMKSRRLNRSKCIRFPLPGRQDSGVGEIKSGARCSADFDAAFDRFGSIASDQRSQRISWMSALPPIAARQQNAAKCQRALPQNSALVERRRLVPYRQRTQAVPAVSYCRSDRVHQPCSHSQLVHAAGKVRSGSALGRRGPVGDARSSLRARHDPSHASYLHVANNRS